MKILLVGDYSNVHATLAEGLKVLGHQVTLASDGDGWKDYPRDIDLRRPSLNKFSSLAYYLRLEYLFQKFKGYDVVQLINPCFLPLKAERTRRFYDFLRRHNKKVFLGAFGMDYFWVKAGINCQTFRYSDFNLGAKVRESAENKIWIRDWLYGAKGQLNQEIAADCDGIVAGLYEYYAAYQGEHGDKLQFIPFPIRVDETMLAEHYGRHEFPANERVRFFIGIQRKRHAYKGTDVMLSALESLKSDYPNDVEIVQVENVPFMQYIHLLRSSDVLLDQLYSYTPAMNALQAMAQGLIVVGGGEPENYAILQEKTLHPIINVLPNEPDVYRQLETLIKNKQMIPQLSHESREYIEKHHDYIKVARQYLDFWQHKGEKGSAERLM